MAGWAGGSSGRLPRALPGCQLAAPGLLQEVRSRAGMCKARTNADPSCWRHRHRRSKCYSGCYSGTPDVPLPSDPRYSQVRAALGC